ncbi:MAG: PH domain-containing protein [Planctomycetes bacterium]|nr:PH domain-containing protein [Planctomycetota bacterium]
MVAQVPVEDVAASAARACPLVAAQDRSMSGSAPEGIEQEMPARARIISPSLLLPAEIVLFEWKPSLWYVVFVSLPVATAGLATLLLAFTVSELPVTVRQWGVVIGVSVVGLRVAAALLQWLGRTYVLTDRRILTQYGVFNVVIECLGLEQIENTFVAQGAGQRILGIGTIFFRCTAGGGMPIAWQHLREPREVHAQVVAQIDRWKRALTGPPVV